MISFGLKPIKKIFEYSSVAVYGLRGRGKDLLMSNVVSRRASSYISNMDYVCKRSEYIPLDFNKLNINNNYKNFINNDLNFYEYPYPEKADIYISDAGVYLPCQYNDKLNKEYSNLPPFMALSRHLGLCNVHYNTQALNRVWDKLREQTDQFIYCKRCFYLFGLVIQFVRFYDKRESAEQNLLPLKKPSIFSKNYALCLQQYNQYQATNGNIKKYLLIYFNRSKYDTRRFKTLLLEGKKINEK